MSTGTRLALIRKQQGIAASELARLVGVKRQTIYAIEDGSYVPNTTIALRLARALDTTVEALFDFELSGDVTTESVRANLLSNRSGSITNGQLVRLCQVNDHLIAVPSLPSSTYLPLMDGVIQETSGSTVSVNSFIPLTKYKTRLLLAGCDPALSLLNELLSPSGFEIITVGASSEQSVHWLQKELVHAAGSHLLDDASGAYNLPFVRRLFPSQSVRLLTFATWEQGLVVQRGNPKTINSIADLNRPGVKIINREEGSGSRRMLDAGLETAGLTWRHVRGYKKLAYGHLEAAQIVARGEVDCCIATRSAALCYGLAFVPLAVERFDLVIPEETLDLPVGMALAQTLNSGAFQKKLGLVAGYETHDTGKVQM